MDLLMSVYDFCSSPAGAGIFLSLLSLSEALAAIPAIKANALHQAIYNGLKMITRKKE